MNLLCHYAWPGNVRELAHVIERSVILSDSGVLDISSVVAVTSDKKHEKQDSAEGSKSQNNDLNNYIDNTVYDCFNLEIIEQRAVRAALKHHQGNVSQAAKALGLTRGAMYRRLEKHDL